MKSEIKDKDVEKFLIDSISQFFIEIEVYQKQSKWDKGYHLIEYGEMALMSFFSNSIAKKDSQNYQYIILQEFELEDPRKKQKDYGRADMIVEDVLNNNIYFIEAKQVWSGENDPEGELWKESETMKYYDKVFEQLNKYFEIINKDSLKSINKIFLIALVFDRVIFKNPKNARLWNYEKLLDNEFYDFRTFEHNDLIKGLSCYGLVKEKEIEKMKS